MEQRNININRPELSKASIDKHKNFDAVLRKQYPHLNLVKNKWFWGGSFLTTLLIAVVVIQIDETENVDPKQEETEQISESPALVEDKAQPNSEVVTANQGVSVKGSEVVWFNEDANAYSYKSESTFQLEKSEPFQVEVNGQVVQASREIGSIDEALQEKKIALSGFTNTPFIRKQKPEDLVFTIDVDQEEFPEFYRQQAIFAFSDKNPEEKLAFFNGIVWDDIQLKQVRGELQLHISKSDRKEFIIVEPIIPADEYSLYEKEYLLRSKEKEELQKEVEALEAQKAAVPYAISIESGSGIIKF